MDKKFSLPSVVSVETEPHTYIGGGFPQEKRKEYESYAVENPRSVPNDTRPGRLLDVKIEFLSHQDFSNTNPTPFGRQIKAEVTSPATKIFASGSLTGTLYDPRMGNVPASIMGGSSSHGCITCGGTSGARRDCVGHMGKIMFPGKIFNPYGSLLMYELIDILTCLCLECGKLYHSPEVLRKKHIEKVRPEARIKTIAKWSEPESVVCKSGDGQCKRKKYSKKDSYKEGLVVYKEGGFSNRKTPDEIHNLLTSLDEEVVNLLGFQSVKDFEKYTLVGVIVPEIKMRLPNQTKNGTEPHPFTEKLGVIVGLSNDWANSLLNKRIADELTELKIDYQRVPNISDLRRQEGDLSRELMEKQEDPEAPEAVIEKLQEEIGRVKAAIEFRTKGLGKNISEGVFKRMGDTTEKMTNLYRAVASYFKETGALLQSKGGIIRSGIVAKRADFTGRAVITPNTYGRLDTIDVPELFAKKAGVTDVVTEENIRKYTQMLSQGKISFIETQDRSGKLGRVPVDSVHISQGSCKLRIGDTITRWLMDGDIVIAGREPSLHPGNIMAFYAKIRPFSTIGVPFGVVTPWAADFDGDAAHLSIPQTAQAKLEAEQLMLASRNIVGIRTGSPIIGVIYNALKVWTVATSSRKVFPEWLVNDAIYDMLSEVPEEAHTVYDIDKLKERCSAHGVDYRTGRGLFSVLLPESFNYPAGNNPSKNGIKIYNGVLVAGTITDVDIAANKPGTIVHQLFRIYEDRDEAYRAAALFIHKAYRLADFIGEHFPLTLSPVDCSMEQCGIEKNIFAKETEEIMSKILAMGEEPTNPYEREAYEQEISNLNQDLLKEQDKLYKQVVEQSEPSSARLAKITEQLDQARSNLKKIEEQDEYGQYLTATREISQALRILKIRIKELEDYLQNYTEINPNELEEEQAYFEQLSREIEAIRFDSEELLKTDTTQLKQEESRLEELSRKIDTIESDNRKLLRGNTREAEAIRKQIADLKEERGTSLDKIKKMKEAQQVKNQIYKLETKKAYSDILIKRILKSQFDLTVGQPAKGQLQTFSQVLNAKIDKKIAALREKNDQSSRQEIKMLEEQKWLASLPEEPIEVLEQKFRELKEEFASLNRRLSKLKSDVPDSADYLEKTGELTRQINELHRERGVLVRREKNVDEGMLNQFYLGIKAGTKGTPAEFREMMGMIGRLTIEGMNDVSCGTRCLSGYRVGSKEAGARGFATRSFVEGLSIPEKFNAQKVQRKPQFDAATKTPEAGALERELSLTLGQYFTDSNSLVSHSLNLLQYSAGEDGFHPNYLYPLYGVNVPFDPKILAETINGDCGWRKFEDGKWYHKHELIKEIKVGEKTEMIKETYYVEY